MLNITKNGETVFIEVVGLINEEIRLNKLDFKDVKNLVFNFDKVDAINSIGVKLWIGYLSEIPQNINVKYSKCRRVVVDQMNMVMGFKPPQVGVESFYVPYYCDDTGTVEQVLYTLGKEFDADGKLTHPANVLHSTSQKPMEMDVMEAKYFKFLSRK